MNFTDFPKFPKKTELPAKFKLTDKGGIEPTEMRKKDSCHPPPPPPPAPANSHS